MGAPRGRDNALAPAHFNEADMPCLMFRWPSLLLLTAALAGPSSALAGTFDLNVSGSWTPFLDDNDLVGGAGTDLPGTLDSDSDEIALDINGADDDADTWRVEVHYDGSPFWGDDLQLEVRRVNDGFGGGSITGGESFTAIQTGSSVIFTGAGDRTGLRLQLRLTGLTVTTLEANTYLTQITYTVVDT